MKKLNYVPNTQIGVCTFICDTITSTKHRQGLFLCPICNNEFNARIDHIKNKSITSCGCARPCESHGDSNTRLYHIWEAMKQRCLNIKHAKYLDYGARGITVCQDWLIYSQFKEWALTTNYSELLTIDRINNNKGYCPENCRWAAKATQQANRRTVKTNSTGYRGVEASHNKFYSRIVVNGKKTCIGIFTTALAAALARDKYIKIHNLPHTLSIPDVSLVN